jgi:hypothetical protein
MNVAAAPVITGFRDATVDCDREHVCMNVVADRKRVMSAWIVL